MGLLTLLSPQQEHYLQRFQANVGAGGSFDPTIVLAAGAPTPVWTITDQAATTEKMLNGGFETPGTGGADIFGSWTEDSASGTLTDETTIVHSGGHSAKLVRNATGGNLRVLATTLVAPGQTYRVSAWHYGDGTHAGVVDLWDNNNLGGISVATGSNGGNVAASWNQIVFTFVAPAGCLSVAFIAKAGSINPSTVYFDDVSVKAVYNTTVYNTPAITHVQSGVADMQVSLGPPSILGYITQLNVGVDGLMGTFTQADLLRLPALTQLGFNANPLLSCRFALSTLPTAMTALNLNSTPSILTGALSDLKAASYYLDLGGTSSAIIGGATAIAATGITSLNLGNTVMTQATVDGVVNRIYGDRALFTAAAPTLSIGGSNAAPSGVYQFAEPPTSGKEAIYMLVHPTGAEKPWTITYTA